ncbi:MAG: NAD-dependent epimerase/dehydratase family protein [Gemmatimonadota bacterium]|nr:NAD-dependent epimerase/dehydratase family protein [Gemmatimonadota bacterium]
MTILVTGATGFTGGHLAEHLLRNGERVRLLVRDAARAARFEDAGAELALGDFRDPAAVERAMEGVRLVYHIGALFRQENVSSEEMHAVNAAGTRTLLEAAERAGVERFVHCSTIGVHGDVKNPPADEDAPYAPGDHYQISKTEGEKIALGFMREGRLPVVVFRPGGIYGPGDLRFLKLVRAVARGRFVMFGSGEILYQMVYIDDLVSGIVACGTHPAAVGRVYILTGDPAVTLNELVATVATVTGSRPPRLRLPVTPLYLAGWLCEILLKPLGIDPPLHRRRVDFFRKTRSFDISRARRELGWSPEVDLQTGLARTVAWYRAQGLL